MYWQIGQSTKKTRLQCKDIRRDNVDYRYHSVKKTKRGLDKSLETDFYLVKKPSVLYN